MKLEATFQAPGEAARDPDAVIGRMVTALECHLAARLGLLGTSHPRLADAMGYSLLLPAKRARGVLALLSAVSWGADWRDALDAAASLELVHAASLVLDDLPAMDNAAMRRGERANHVVHGEAVAILAAIALMNEGYAVIAADTARAAAQRTQLTAILAGAIGPQGLTGGQEADIAAKLASHAWTVDEVERIHAAKTGALFSAATAMGAVVAGCGAAGIDAFAAFGLRLGIAFQGLDDLIDARAAAAAAGKDVGKDKDKPTVVALLGADAAEARACGHVRRALADIGESGADDALLRHYVDGLIEGLLRRGRGARSAA